MTINHRLLKLENAFITLSGLATKSDARTSRLEESFVMLTELAVITNERLDDQQQHVDSYQQWIESLAAAQANTDVKMASLTDAKIRTEAAQANT